MDILDLFCSYLSCTNPTCYGSIYCGVHIGNLVNHTLADFENNRFSRYCVYPGCTIEKEYRHPLCVHTSHCWYHKTTVMKKKPTYVCGQYGCKKRASYNYSHESFPSCCHIHKASDMVNLNKRKK